MVISTGIYTQPVIKTMLRLPDTGETISYTNTPGEDADFNIHPPYFIINGNGTVTDTVTGLMWQQTDGGEMTVESAVIYCDTLSLGGYTDWRMPNPHELFSIINHQNVNPALNTAVFPNTGAAYWWSSVRQINDSNKVWCTNSGGGVGNHPKSETISAGGTKKFHIRAVRDVTAPTTIPYHFTDNGNGTITDNLTNLVWQKNAYPDSLTWEQALTYADTLTQSGLTDWRLPNIKELQSLNDESRINPSINNTFFTNIATNKYWSSTTLPNHTTWAWYLNTQFGITTYDDKNIKHYLLCVRGNENVLPLKLLSFTAKFIEKKVLLNWKTINQINTLLCNVERSLNGNYWVRIGSVASSAIPTLSNYLFTDQNPVSGKNFYRIQFVDKDGQLSYSKIQLIDLNNTDDGVYIYPNPAKDYFNIKVNSELTEKLTSISVYNSKGDLSFYTREKQSKYEIDNFNKGAYVVKIKLRNSLITKRLIIQ